MVGVKFLGQVAGNISQTIQAHFELLGTQDMMKTGVPLLIWPTYVSNLVSVGREP